MDSKQLFYIFGTLLYRIDGFYDNFAKNSNVKSGLMWLLYAINDGKPHSQKEICESWSLPRSTINTLTKQLEREGYVQLAQIKGEKRELALQLTQQGTLYAEKLLKELYAIEDEVCQTFGTMQQLNENLEKFSQVLYLTGAKHNTAK